MPGANCATIVGGMIAVKRGKPWFTIGLFLFLFMKPVNGPPLRIRSATKSTQPRPTPRKDVTIAKNENTCSRREGKRNVFERV